MPPLDPPPHAHRAADLLRRQTEPRVQLWAWPGAGASEALAALAQEEGRRAASVEDSPQGFVRRSPEVRWLLWARPDPAPADFVERVAPPGVRFLFWGRERSSAEGAALAAVIPPTELLLTEAEVGELVERHTAGGHGSELVRRLWQASDGWWMPLELALTAGAGSRRLDPSAEGLVAVPAVASFLRQEVVAPLPADVQELLLELAGGETLEESFWRQVWGEGDPRLGALSDFLDRQGLVVEASRSRRLPRLLAAHLRLERGRRWPVARAFAAAQRLAAVAFSLGRVEDALAALVQAADPLRAGELLELEWPQLLGAAPVTLLRAAFRLTRPREGGGGELLALAAEAATGDRRRAAAGLAELAARREARSQAGGAVPAVARALLAAARAGGAAPEVAATAAQELAALGPLPRGLAPLLAALEGGAAAAEGAAALELPAVPSTVADHLLLSLLRLSAPAAARQEPAGKRQAAGPVVSAGLLGPPRVRAGDGGATREVTWPLKKALRVFTYLASSPELEASREELVEAVWGDEDDAAIERNFHPTLSHLRRALTRALPGLPPPLQRRGGSYRLSPAIDWRIDVVEFDALLKRGRQRQEAGDASAAIEHWQAAWRLYGGPFLAGEHGDWVSERREALLQTYVELLRRLGETLLESGELQRAMDAYRTLLIADRLQERAHVAMMRIYGRLARRDLVRRQYDRLSELLRDELGVEPLSETTAEYHRLMG